MFYSQFILAKKGPLGTIWIAAHLERKLRKNQVADTDIGVSVDSILFPDVPIALRLSSHLLLGVVRIYSRKVNYLFHDCSEALLKVKQAFRSTAVDLPPEESTAPYHSITLPETFDLDDFELPDSEIFLGNYVDHHVSTREQITLQDTMDGVVYSTSQFGLDERFGDGDTSQIALDLDEDLFLDKVTTPGHTMVLLDSNDVDPQASAHPMTPFTETMDIDEDENKSGGDGTAIGSYVMPTDAAEEQIDSNPQDQNMADNSSTLNHNQIQASDINDKGFLFGHIESSSADQSTDLVGCPQGPSTPGLVEEVVPANDRVQEVSALTLVKENCDSSKFVAEESLRDSNNAGDSSFFNNNNRSETDDPFMANVENGPLLGVEAMAPISSDVACLMSSPTSVLADEQTKPTSLASEFSDRTLGATENRERVESSQNGVTSNEKSSPPFVDQTQSEGVAHQGISSDKDTPFHSVEESVSLNSKLNTDCKHLSEAISERDCILHKESSEPHEFEKAEAKTCLESEDTEIQNIADHNENMGSQSLVLRPCNSLLNKPNVSSLGDENLAGNAPDLSPGGRQSCISENLGQECDPSNDRVTALEANQILVSVPSGSVQGDLSKSDDCLDTIISKNTLSENLKCQESSDLPAPEVLLSAPVVASDLPSDLLVESTPEKEVSAEHEISGDGLKSFSGKKNHLMESTPILPDGNSTKLSVVSRPKRTLDSIPDDNDLLSSILVGRSSALKVRPTPPPEAAPSKRRRLAPRASVPKRKVHLDDAMVLHGDTIRQQLISTEDIRRIRKKAPCTRPEIWTIEKQLLEEEIFSEALLTSTSEDMIGLHNHTYDLIETRVSEIDANDTLSEVPKMLEVSRSTNLTIETSMEATFEHIVDGNDGEAHDPTKTLEQTENQSCETQEQTESITGNPPLELPIDGQLGEESAMEIDNRNNGVADIADHSVIHIEQEHNVLAGSMIDVTEMTSRNDENLDRQSVEKDASIPDITVNVEGDAINIAEGEEVGLILVEGVSKASGGSVDVVPQEGLSSPMIVPIMDNCSVENGADLPLATIPMENVDPSFTSTSLGSHEPTDLTVLTDDHTKEGIRSEVGVVIGDGIVADKMEVDEGDSSSKLIFCEGPLRDPSCPLEHNADAENVHFDRENPDCQEANLEKTMDVESIALDTASVKDSGDFGNTIDGNDTEFLNFDEEEAIEEEDDNGMPSAEEARILDNSGWSSRSRAVARYLQTLFDNESEHGRKALPMDNLLSGKTRKEASRMFFETLVLKTRDYIHVEQEKSFDSINIKPRAKLMKSDF